MKEYLLATVVMECLLTVVNGVSKGNYRKVIRCKKCVQTVVDEVYKAIDK